ncbi:hypothetical protein INT48_000177 [Thamnidium elegans]|uniref:Homeobox domain-containing protein n=1 Tax=Thamnidium elegans TaxID=101142 RepID=A0A8H7SYM2_9FUNG|nr:hypothetical protein INT48_000177 [Thamnidium elegans]
MVKEKSRRVYISSEENSTGEEDDILLSEDEIDYGTPVRPRQRFSSEETGILERAFKESPRPTAEMKKDLAVQFGTVPGRIQIWFQNRRAKEKKNSSTSTPQLSESQKSSDKRDIYQVKKPRVDEGVEPIVPLRSSVYYSDTHIPPGPEMFLYPSRYIFTNPRNIDPGVGSSRGYVGHFVQVPTEEGNTVNSEERKEVEGENQKKGSF